MDWYLEADDRAGATELRHEFRSYLERHSDAASDVDLATLAFAELVNNAIEHADGPVWISVDWTADQPLLAVHDMGQAFDLASVSMPAPQAVRGRGLAISADIASRLEVAAKAGGGARVEALLPAYRPQQVDLDPPRRSVNVLPHLDEAGAEGFERESFLRALVVQLAQGLELTQGPLVAEAAIAQVGTDVGGQMEAEYRASIGAGAGNLTPEEAAECYVRLKKAIDGDFYVIEADGDRIVLANRRCPFGEAVLRAPALCRMTSSVFGGIAARNFGEATVVLEERIAVGDPQCRVVVYLGPQPEIDHGHMYKAPQG